MIDWSQLTPIFDSSGPRVSATSIEGDGEGVDSRYLDGKVSLYNGFLKNSCTESSRCILTLVIRLHGCRAHLTCPISCSHKSTYPDSHSRFSPH